MFFITTITIKNKKLLQYVLYIFRDVIDSFLYVMYIPNRSVAKRIFVHQRTLVGAYGCLVNPSYVKIQDGGLPIISISDMFLHMKSMKEHNIKTLPTTCSAISPGFHAFHFTTVRIEILPQTSMVKSCGGPYCDGSHSDGNCFGSIGTAHPVVVAAKLLFRVPTCWHDGFFKIQSHTLAALLYDKKLLNSPEDFLKNVASTNAVHLFEDMFHDFHENGYNLTISGCIRSKCVSGTTALPRVAKCCRLDITSEKGSSVQEWRYQLKSLSIDVFQSQGVSSEIFHFITFI
jgi:hypothetical protein